MKKIVFGLLMSFVGVNAYALDAGNIVDPLLKHCSESSCHRGPRGHTGPRGHRGHRGHKGKPGTPGTLSSSVIDRAYLLAPDEPILINPSDLPMPVPLDKDDLSAPFFDGVTLNGFTVPESGVYRIEYFVSALRVGYQEGTQDTGGLVMGIVIDEDPATAIGLRKLPLVDSVVPAGKPVVFGSHEIFVSLTKDQTVQLGILAAPRDEEEAIEMEFVLSGAAENEVAYLSIQKVGS